MTRYENNLAFVFHDSADTADLSQPCDNHQPFDDGCYCQPMNDGSFYPNIQAVWPGEVAPSFPSGLQHQHEERRSAASISWASGPFDTLPQIGYIVPIKRI